MIHSADVVTIAIGSKSFSTWYGRVYSAPAPTLLLHWPSSSV
jgi:hypothetical protein